MKLTLLLLLAFANLGSAQLKVFGANDVVSYMDINGNYSWLNANKAALAHVHLIADITSLQTVLDQKAPLNSPSFTGTVVMGAPVLGLDQATPTPDSTRTQLYAKGGRWCSQSTAGIETCMGTGGSMVYPGAGVPISTGSTWGTSYAVGTAPNSLVQLNSSGQLPAISAANLTNFPTFNQSTTGNAATATALATAPAKCSAGNYPRGIDAAGNAQNCTAAGGGRMFGYTFVQSGGLAAGNTGYLTMPYACTISGWNISVDAGTASVDVWKVATGTAIPTVSNTITASATPAIAAGTAIHSATLTGWTTSVAANDVIGINLKAVSGAAFVNLTVECQ
jgi:hypothetical protein